MSYDSVVPTNRASNRPEMGELRERSVADMLILLEDVSRDISARTRAAAAVVGAFSTTENTKAEPAASNLYSRLESIFRNLEQASSYLDQFEQMMAGVV